MGKTKTKSSRLNPERCEQANFRAAHRLALQLMPDDGDLDALVDRLADRRKRPIVVETTTVEALSGQTFALETSDRIFLRVAPPGQSRQALCHELAHLLLGHLEQEDHPLDKTLAQLIDIDPATIRKFVARHAYDSPEEVAAERLGTILRVESDRRVRQARRRDDPRAQRLF